MVEVGEVAGSAVAKVREGIGSSRTVIVAVRSSVMETGVVEFSL